MADRTVTTRLKLAVDQFKAGGREAESTLTKLNRKFVETAGFAQGFRKKLEEATKRLPTIEINANSSAAEVKMAQVRREMEALAAKKIGVDIDATTALAEMKRLQGELRALEDGASFEVRAGIRQALEDLAAVGAEARRLDGRDVKIKIDADTKSALINIGKVVAATQALSVAAPAAAGLVAAGGALEGAFASAAAGALAFKAAAVPTFERVKKAVDSADFSKLSPEEYRLAEQWQSFSNVYLDWQRSVNPSVTQALGGGLGLMGQALPKISPLVTGTASAFVGLEKNAERALNGPFWTQFLQNLGVAAPQAVTGFGNSLLKVGTGVAGVIDAFLPFTPNVVNPIEHASEAFARWGQNLKNSPEFQQFLAYVKENAPEAWELVKNLAKALGNIGEAVIPLGVGSMSGLSLLAKLVAGMDPEHIRLIALAILAVKGAQAGLKVASFWTDLTGKLGGLGGAADTAKGKLGGLAGTLSSSGGVAALMAGAAIAVNSFGDELAGLNVDIGQLAKQMNDLAQRGASAPEMLTRFGSNINTLKGDVASSAAWFAPVVGQFETLGDTVRRLNSDNPFAQLSNSITSSVQSFYSIDTGRQRLENFDKTLTQMVSSGNGQQAASLFNELAKQAGLSGGKVDQLRALLPGYSSAVQAAQAATAPTTGSIKEMGTSAATAAGNVDTLRGAIGQLVGLTTNAMSAEINYKRSLDDAAKSIKENGQATSTNTEKGRANREALIGLAQSANQYRQALIEQGTPLAEVTAKVGAQRSAFIGLAEKMGFSKTQASNLATALGLIPGNVKTDVKTPGGKEALDLIREYQRKINELNGKTVNVFVNSIYNTVSGKKAIANKVKAAGGIQTTAGYELMATGGIRGGSSNVPPPPMVRDQPTLIPASATIFGEAGKEAYIPYASQYRSRAINLLSQVAADFNLEVYSKRAEQKTAALTDAVNQSRIVITGDIRSASNVLSATLGSAGTLTSAVVDVGNVGQQVVTAWGDGTQALDDSVAGLSDTVGSSVDGLSGAIDSLTAAVESLASAISSAKSSASKSSSSSSKSKGTGRSSQGERNVPSPHGTGRGSQGERSVPAPRGSGRGAAGQNVPAPHNLGRSSQGERSVPSPRGTGRGSQGERNVPAPSKDVVKPLVVSGDRVAPLGGSSGSYVAVSQPATGSYNSARMSAPKVVAVAARAPATQSTATPAGGSSYQPPASSGVTVNVDMSGSVVREEPDIDKIGKSVGFNVMAQGPV
ncbi:hypothetical protein [Nonomuraea sediminis]|uniref:hypothetical protein n=1 Tax=Nonomuraea sediminis TaxID=2835864 RepID=UPI001BDD0A36|nr:hypothetical protein [Nonomuraea sediminis]